MMSEAEIRRIVRATIEEERAKSAEHIDASIIKTMSAILTGFGIDEEDRREIRRDMAHLRHWRKSVEQVQRVTWTTAIMAIVTGIAGALWLGIRMMLGGQDR